MFQDRVDAGMPTSLVRVTFIVYEIPLVLAYINKSHHHFDKKCKMLLYIQFAPDMKFNQASFYIKTKHRNQKSSL